MRFRSLAFLALLLPLTLAAQAPPELPRSVPSAAMPATTRTLAVAAGGNLQAALDSAKGGDAIELACGAAYTGPFTLPAKQTTGWIVVRPACASSLPASGTRMTPATAAALALPKIITPDYQAAIYTQLGAHHYRLVGVEITISPKPTLNYGLVLLGSGGQDQNTVASIAHDLVLDRVYVHGSDTVNVSRCVALNSATTVIVDSYLSECHAEGQDAQAIGGWNGPGPYLIQNNYLEGSGENIMFGGADPAVQNLMPSDITIIGNHIMKPHAWLGSRWSIKNLIEIKAAQRMLVEGNVLEGSWVHSQSGFGVVVWSANQSGTATWTATSDFTFRRNVMRYVGAGFALAGTGSSPSIPLARVAITQNLIYGVDAPGYDGEGRGFQIGGGNGSITDILIDRNTMLGQTKMALLLYGNPTLHLRVTNNILDGGIYGMGGDAVSIGLAGFVHYAPDGVFSGNVLVLGGDYAQYAATLFPPGNAYPTTLAAVQLDSLYRLTSASPYHDVGADAATVWAATASALSGVTTPAAPTPTPTPGPVVALNMTLTQLRTAIAALDKVTGPSGRENLATKAALVPVDVYLKALLSATTSASQP